ncbi:MAG: hypothetical protein ACTSX1_11375 [Candidatus Heimdallarchaeaceae archaeon]
MTIIQIGIIVLATIWSVHFVYVSAYKRGVEAGIGVGCIQILKEDMIRSDHRRNDYIDPELISMVESASNPKPHPNKHYH